MRSGPSKTGRTEANKMDAGSIFVSRGGDAEVGLKRFYLQATIIPATTHSPTGTPGSTIGAWRLNFCVRNGNRWNPPAIITGMILAWRWDTAPRPDQGAVFWVLAG